MGRLAKAVQIQIALERSGDLMDQEYYATGGRVILIQLKKIEREIGPESYAMIENYITTAIKESETMGFITGYYFAQTNAARQLQIHSGKGRAGI